MSESSTYQVAVYLFNLGLTKVKVKVEIGGPISSAWYEVLPGHREYWLRDVPQLMTLTSKNRLCVEHSFIVNPASIVEVTDDEILVDGQEPEFW